MSEPEKIVIPYEKQAMKGEEIPEGLDYPDQVLFLELRTLYYHLKQGIIDRPTGSREKKRLLDEYKMYKVNWEMGDHWAKIWRATDMARCEYRKDRTIENADKLLAAIDGVIS